MTVTPPAPPVVSIVIPCYNQAKYLSDALDSLAAQTYPALDVIVIDDGSSDHPEAIARRFRGVRVIRQKNRGLSAARNAGLSASRGAFIVFLDADDRLRPDAVRIGIERLLENTAAAFTVGRCALIDAGGEALPIEQPVHPAGDLYDQLLRECFIWNPATVVYRRKIIQRVGGFQAGVDASSDYDLYLRIARAFPIDTHDAIVAEYRHHQTCMTAKPAAMLRATLAALRSQRGYIARRPQYKDAFVQGRRFWQNFYGSLLVDQIRSDMHVRSRWVRALWGAAILLRYAPHCFIHHAGRKARLTVMRTPVAPDDSGVMRESQLPLPK